MLAKFGSAANVAPNGTVFDAVEFDAVVFVVVDDVAPLVVAVFVVFVLVVVVIVVYDLLRVSTINAEQNPNYSNLEVLRFSVDGCLYS